MRNAREKENANAPLLRAGRNKRSALRRMCELLQRQFKKNNSLRFFYLHFRLIS